MGDSKVQHEGPKTGLHDVRTFIGACSIYHRHIKIFTYTSAILTNRIRKSSTWRWGPQEQQAFDDLKDKAANAKCLGMPKAQGEILLLTDASNVGGGGALFQWQALGKEEFDWGTDELKLDGTLRHSYHEDNGVLNPMGNWSWKWNQATGNYSSYEQELLAGMLMVSSQYRLLGSNPVVWLCDQEPVPTFQKGPPPEETNVRRWWTYLRQLRLSVHHIPGVKNAVRTTSAATTLRHNWCQVWGTRQEGVQPYVCTP